ncbi:MAG: hypothetical protein IPJ32_14950 [Sphingobacteriaceae bacterium]|nr:hypothetical protein [Sphingobacteriaceae bacterium]
MNQLIAHHGVIFKPKSGLMWVSTAPYQCGEFVCYDLNKVFNEYTKLEEDQEIISDSLTIPADEFLKSEDYKQFVKFKNLKHYIQFITKAPGYIYLSGKLENAFVKSNPQSYYTYQILGDYFKSKYNYQVAFNYYKKALVKEIASVKEENQIKKEMMSCFKHLN